MYGASNSIISEDNCLQRSPGDLAISEPPLPIPNREVKPYCSDDTYCFDGWESRIRRVITEDKIKYRFRAVFYLLGSLGQNQRT